MTKIDKPDYPLRYQTNKEINRITVKIALYEILHVFNLDRGIGHAVKMLLIKPGSFVRAYLGEKRHEYMHPFRLLIITTALSLLVFNFPETLISLDDSGLNNAEELKAQVETLQKVVIEWYNLILWGSIPVYAFFTWIFNRKKGYNYAEIIVLFSYYMSVSNIFTILAGLVSWWHVGVAIYIALGISTIYYFIFLHTFFQTNTIGFFFKNLLAFIFSNIIYYILLSVILIVIIKF